MARLNSNIFLCIRPDSPPYYQNCKCCGERTRKTCPRRDQIQTAGHYSNNCVNRWNGNRLVLTSQAHMQERGDNHTADKTNNRGDGKDCRKSQGVEVKLVIKRPRVSVSGQQSSCEA